MSDVRSETVNSSEAKSIRVSAEVYLPLELTKNLHVCLWSEDNTYKWTIGYFTEDKEGPWFKFVGNRPLDKRVNWKHFGEIVKLGYALAEHTFEAKQKNSFD